MQGPEAPERMQTAEPVSPRPHRLTVLFSVIAAVTAAVGLGLTFLALRLNSDNQDRARTAARHADRAYLAVTSTTIELVHERLKFSQESQTARLTFTYRVENRGKTPADVISVALSFPGLPSFWKTRPDRVVPEATERFFLGAGAAETRVKHAAFDVDRDAALSRQSSFDEAIVVNASLVFRDVADSDDRSLRWCWQMLPAAGQDGLAIFTDKKPGGAYLNYRQAACIGERVK